MARSCSTIQRTGNGLSSCRSRLRVRRGGRERLDRALDRGREEAMVPVDALRAAGGRKLDEAFRGGGGVGTEKSSSNSTGDLRIKDAGSRGRGL